MRERLGKRTRGIALATLTLCGTLIPALSRADCVSMPNPQDVVMASSAESKMFGASYNFFKCFNKETFRCWFTITKTTPGIANWGFPRFLTNNIKLNDNFQEPHSVIRGAFYTGRCRDLLTLDFNENDSSWFYLDFDAPSNDITSATIKFPSWFVEEYPRAYMVFRGPVEH